MLGVSSEDRGLQRQVEHISLFFVGALPRFEVRPETATSIWSELGVMFPLAELVNGLELVDDAEAADNQIKVFHVRLREVVALLLDVGEDGCAHVRVLAFPSSLDETYGDQGDTTRDVTFDCFNACDPFII